VKNHFSVVAVLFTNHGKKEKESAMPDEVSLLPLALVEVEREIAAVDSEFETLTTKATTLAVKKGSLQKTQRGLAELLGRVPTEPSPLRIEALDKIDLGSGTSLVARNAFRYMGPAAAARKLLRKMGHRMTHPEVVEALFRGNVKSRSKYPSDSIRAAMLRRKDWFVWKKEPGHFGYWELVEWQHEDESVNGDGGIGRNLLSLVKS
jgi:hypothetical protein